MQLDWWTLALQAINFLILVWLLQRFLYRPVKGIIEKRKELADRAFAEADEKKAEAGAVKQGFEEKLAQLSEERQETLKKAHQELEVERAKILDAARSEAGEIIETTRAAIAKERKAALADIRKETAALAAELAADLLRKTATGAPNSAFLGQLEQHLAALPPDERDQLQRDLSMDGAHLTVVTAAPLELADQELWRTRLAACLGQPDKTDFAIDPEILGGAELRFPHSVLRFTWADQLRNARDVMGRDDDAT